MAAVSSFIPKEHRIDIPMGGPQFNPLDPRLLRKRIDDAVIGAVQSQAYADEQFGRIQTELSSLNDRVTVLNQLSDEPPQGSEIQRFEEIERDVRRLEKKINISAGATLVLFLAAAALSIGFGSLVSTSQN